MRPIITPWNRTVGFVAAVVGIAAFAHGQQPLVDTANVVTYSGQSVPGLPGVTISGATLMDSASIDDSGAVIFRARLAGTGVTALNERAFLYGDTYGNLSVLIRSGDPAPGLPGLTLNTAAGTGISGSPRVASNGFTFWGSSLSGPGVVAANDTALFSGFAGSLGLVAREGAPAPGTVGATFGSAFNNPSYQPTGVNRNGRVLFQSATLGGDTTTANNAGWWTGLPGALELVQRKGDAAPGGTVIGALSFLSQMNDSGQVLVDAALSQTLGTSPATTANDQTLWIWTPGVGNQLVAREGDPAPGTVGATLNNATNNNSFFFNGGGDLFNNAGQGVVQCDLKGGDVIPGFNDRGLYRATTSGLTMLIRRGDPAAGTDGGFDQVNHATMHHVNGGKISFVGNVSGGTQTALNDTGIWAGTPGSLKVVMRENDPAPGLPAGVVFDNFLGTNMMMNEQGRVTVFAPLRGGDTVAFFNDRAEYCWDLSVGLVLVGRLQQPYQIAPGDTRALASLGHVLFNNGDGNPLGFNRNGKFALRISVSPPNNGSNGAILTFDFPTPTAPTITTQPSNAVACLGGSASFHAAATGFPYPTYQWLFEGSPLSEGDLLSSTLVVNPVTLANLGSYTCVITNSSGSVETIAVTLGLDPTDTDGDSTPDCTDSCPNDPNKIAPGQCGCGVADTDTDLDGTADCNDLCANDPNKIAPGQCGCGVADTDTDGDGTADCVDLCANDPNKIDPGVCGCGTSDIDTDSDGTPDCSDLCPTDSGKVVPGACGCGVSDVDSDSDGTPDCNDLCASDPNKVAPGECGCGVADVDSDNDGTLDCNDLCPNDPNKIAPGVCGCDVAETDSDGDGTPDCSDLCANDPDKVAPGPCGCGTADVDTDGDLVFDCVDNCPDSPNLGQEDADADGLGDSCDNCPSLANAGQEDCDSDGLGDVCEIAGGEPDVDLNGIPDVCEDCNNVFSYCTSKPNSAGCLPTIQASGTPSAGVIVAPFDLFTDQALPNKAGTLVYSVLGPNGAPFQGGTLCLMQPVKRTPLQTSSATGGPPCTGDFHFDFNARIQSGIDPALVAGQKVWAQYWSRDSGVASGTSLTNGLTFTICP